VIGPSGNVRVLVATKPVDFRKGADGLAALVRETLRIDPFSGVVYVFRAKRADRVKLIFWDGTGVVLVAKRLENGKFRWPAIHDGVMRLSAAQLQALLEGLDWERRETGERQRVQVPYDEGVANHIGPESCAGGREAGREALTGVRVGQPLSGVRLPLRSADALQSAEGKTSRRVNASAGRLRVVERPWHARTSLAWEPRDLRFARRQPGGGPHGKGRGP
jgi:transposase